MIMRREDLQDLLMDLQHDLGKYLRMPLGFLPADASAVDVRAALKKALLQTKDGRGGVRSARQLWQACLEEGGEDLRALPGFPGLERDVERALRWEAVAMQEGAAVDRQAAQADLSAVQPAIRALLQQLGDAD